MHGVLGGCLRCVLQLWSGRSRSHPRPLGITETGSVSGEATVQVLASLSAGATSGLLVALAERWLDVGPSGFGLLLAAIGVDAATGPLLLRRFVRAGDKRWLFGPFAVRGGVDLTLAAVASPVVASGALVVHGMSTSTGMVAYQSNLQAAVPADTCGRAFAFYDVLWNTARLVSLALGGVVAELADIRIVYVACGALLLAAAGIGLRTDLQDRAPAGVTSGTAHVTTEADL